MISPGLHRIKSVSSCFEDIGQRTYVDVRRAPQSENLPNDNGNLLGSTTQVG
jgi:hypothetical protein